MAILVFAGVLSVPSAVFADASWYGSLRGGLNVGGGNDAKFFDGGSRWGIKGSSEAGEGLTAVYRFEHKISTTNAGQPGGRLAYVGLTGGFGSLTLGQIWNAAYNHAGAITDQSYYFGDAGTGYRHGNALSYAFSSGAVGFQLDLIADGGSDTGKAIDKTEFGMTIGLGEIGRVAIAHTNQRDYYVQRVVEEAVDAVPLTYWVDHDGDEDTATVEVEKIMVTLDVTADTTPYVTSAASGATAAVLADAAFTQANFRDGTNGIVRTANGFQIGDAAITCADATATAAATCHKFEAYVRTTTATTSDAGGGTVTVAPTDAYYAKATEAGGDAAVPAVMGRVLDKDDDGEEIRGFKTTHVAVQFSVGGVSPYIGYSEKKMNGSAAEMKTTHYGLSGSLGDTGMSYLLMARNVKDAEGKKTSPWVANVSRSLGGGATVIFEHGNADDGKSGQSRLGLHVNF